MSDDYEWIRKQNKIIRWYNKGTEGLYREGEEYIEKDGYWSCRYAKYVLKGRFVRGEETIKDQGYWDEYVEFLKSKGIEI